LSEPRDAAIHLNAIRRAAERIAPWAHRTPVARCRSIEDQVGCELHFKCEQLQKVGAFKFRGATNAVFSLSHGLAARGVATHSSGNHAQALALAARNRGIPAHIVMPANASQVKRAAVQGYGAEITTCEPTLEARETTLDEVVARTGAHFVHPYDDHRVITGAATAALELHEQVPGLELLLAPVGGGGLLAGTALATQLVAPGCRVIGVEPAGADDAYRSFRAGHIIPSVRPDTVADGLLTSLGERNFAILQGRLEDIVTVDERAIIVAMRLLWQRAKLLVEPSSAVPLAALIGGALDTAGARTGIILSGGNVDLDALPW
jgi:threonine dehydratase